MNKPTTSTYLDIRRCKNDGTANVKLRVTFERKQRYYPTPYNLSKIDFERIMFGKNLKENEKKQKLYILAFENKATEIINRLPIFNWNSFDILYEKNQGNKNVIYDAFEEVITELTKEGRLGSASSYRCTQKSIHRFDPKLTFGGVTIEWLKQYERWMLKNNNSSTTIGIYLRSLRALFNRAIADGLMASERYPFGKRKYEIPTGRNIKKSLSIDSIQAIFQYPITEGSVAQKCRDYWAFIYMCNGINMKDLCLLKYENIQDDMILFQRAKTANTKRISENIRAVITDEMKNIIERWGTKPILAKNYIFPILSEGLSTSEERKKIQHVTSRVNFNLKKIGQSLGIKQSLTTYVARHSFSTILMRSGASIEFISESLGHSNVQTTQSYLGSFEDTSKKEIIKALTAFANN